MSKIFAKNSLIFCPLMSVNVRSCPKTGPLMSHYLIESKKDKDISGHVTLVLFSILLCCIVLYCFIL